MPTQEDSDDPSKQEPEGYSHLPSEPAEKVLQTWINRYKTLQWLPVFRKGKASIIALEDESTSVYDSLKKVYLNCGWPNNFDGKAFVEKRQKWEDTDLKEYIEQMEAERKKVFEEPDDE